MPFHWEKLPNNPVLFFLMGSRSVSSFLFYLVQNFTSCSKVAQNFIPHQTLPIMSPTWVSLEKIFSLGIYVEYLNWFFIFFFIPPFLLWGSCKFLANSPVKVVPNRASDSAKMSARVIYFAHLSEACNNVKLVTMLISNCITSKIFHPSSFV